MKRSSTAVCVLTVCACVSTLWMIRTQRVELLVRNTDKSLHGPCTKSIQIPTTRRPQSDDSLENHAFFIKRKTKVNPLNFDFSICGPGCGNSTKRAPFLVVIVLTMHSHVTERDAIRSTWGSVSKAGKWGEQPLNHDFMVLFMLGTTDNQNDTELVAKENLIHSDIVEANFKESYFNLTYKVLSGFTFVERYYPNTRYILKLDEDTFINVKYLVKILEIVDMDNKILGPLFDVSSVERKGKHKISKEAYPVNFYPPHVKGNFYAMPSKLAFTLLATSEYVPYMSIEDTYITGILPWICGEGSHIGIDKEAYNPFDKTALKVCDFSYPTKLASQKVTPKLLRDVWGVVLGNKTC